MEIRIQFFISMRFRIQVAKTFRIHPDPDPSQTLKSQKVGFYIKQVKNIHKKLKKNFGKAGNQVSLQILVNFHASGSGSAFPVRIWIQDRQMNADPDSQHYFRPSWILIEP